jgi:penicillin-binding protein 2
LYSPGSVFKVVTAAAALETKKITTNTRFFCQGSYRLGKAKFDCWKNEGHGSQDVVGGLMNSCNVFFYNTGRAAGVDAIETYSKIFGFGRLTGVDLPDEVKGLAPGRVWKRSVRHSGWFEGDTINYSIGQGYLLVTPIQVMDMMGVVANGGFLVRPYIVKRIDDIYIQPDKPKYLGISPKTINVVREGLYEVINNENGTGKRAKVEGVIAAGKTGTAQNPQGRTHAWFAGFAPFKDPKICVVVFLEHGGKGGVEPTVIARGIFEEARKKGYL